MKRLEIFNSKDEQLIPVTNTSAVYDKEKNRLDEVLEKKIEADEADISTDVAAPDPINIHTRSLMSELLINVKNYTIAITDWIKSDNIYSVEIINKHIKDTSVVNIYMDADNSKIANIAGLYPYTESTDGKITIYSETIPSEDIICDYTIQTPVESVTESITASSTVARLDAEIANLKNQLANMIKIKENITISVDSWVLSEGNYYTDIEDTDVTVNSDINLTIQKDSLDIANNAGLYPDIDTFHNIIRLYSETIPSEDIVCDYRIINPYTV